MTSYATLKLAHELLYNYDRAVQWNKDIADDWAKRILLNIDEPPRYLLDELKPVKRWDAIRDFSRSATPKIYVESEILKEIRSLYANEYL